MKVPVSERALVQRVNRVLGKDDEQLKKARSGRTSQGVGEFYTIDIRRNCVVKQDVDIEKMGRTLGVLKNYEQLRS